MVKVTAEEHSWSAADWREWLAGEVATIEGVYARSPMHLINAHHNEKKYAAEYRGRELLELLQNADDASAGDAASDRAIIVLSDEGLCFANSGAPFSRRGVQSLMVSDNSPKRYGNAQLIGNKGLGFRSVLSWTECPFVLSGELAVGFDKERARRWLADLTQRSPALRERVEEVVGRFLEPPVPTLAVPTFLPRPEDPKISPAALTFERTWTLAQSLRDEGYDTVVALPFTEQGALSQARDQLDALTPEVLLFLRNVRELVVRRPEGEMLWSARKAGQRPRRFPDAQSLGHDLYLWFTGRAGHVAGGAELLGVADLVKGCFGKRRKPDVPIDSPWATHW